MTDAELRIARLESAADLPLPSYRSGGAAGLDLHAAVPEDAPLLLAPGDRVLVPTGLLLAIPDGCEGQVRPRSGLALEHGLTVLNAPGTIDSDYRGELKVLLVNLGSAPVAITRGMRIAQLVIAPVVRMRIADAGGSVALGTTGRGTGGFGSTGAR